MRLLYLLIISLCIVVIGCSSNKQKSQTEDVNFITDSKIDSLFSKTRISRINLDSVTVSSCFESQDTTLISTFDLLIGKMQYLDVTGKVIAEGCCLGFEEGDWEAEGEYIGNWHYYINDTIYTRDYGMRYKSWVKNLLEENDEINGLICSSYPMDFDKLDSIVSESDDKGKWLSDIKSNSVFIQHIIGIYDKDPIYFLTKLHGTLSSKSVFCMRDMMCLLVQSNEIPKSVVAKDIASLSNPLIQNDLFDWLGLVIE